ncbi:MAG: translation initiation factor IF-3 [Mycoplasmoidaceae bacterium]
MSQQTKYLLNEDIKDKTLFVIDDNGEKLGELETKKALELAYAKNLDLVLLSKNNEKAIAKIIDFKKFIYESKKKKKESKKNQNVIKNKEIKVKPTIGDHDLNVRIANAKKWLAAGDRIRFVILAYGRIGTKTELIQEIYEKFINALGEDAKIQTPLKSISPVQYEAIIISKKK